MNFKVSNMRTFICKCVRNSHEIKDEHIIFIDFI